MCIFDNQPYGSDTAGNVYQIFTGATDNVDFDNLPNIIPAGSIQTSYQDYGSGAVFKIFKLLTLIFLGSAAPALVVSLAREFGIYTPSGTPSIPGNQGGALWGVGLWNVAQWSGGPSNTYIARLGLAGIAYYASMLISVTAYGGSRYTGMSVAYEKGDSML